METASTSRSNWARKASGWSLLAVGLAGCVLPVLPGVPLALAGLVVLGRDYAWARSALRKAKRGVVVMRRRTRTKQSGTATGASPESRESKSGLGQSIGPTV